MIKLLSKVKPISAVLIFVMLPVSFSYAALKESETCKDLLAVSITELPNKGTASGDNEWIETLKIEWKKQNAEFSKRQRRLWTEALEHLTEDLNGLNENSNTKDRLLKEHLQKATQKLPAIYEAWLSLKAKDKRSGYNRENFEAVWAALAVHSHEVMDAQSVKTDFPRYFKILKAIGDFDPQRSRLSFYRVRRAVEGRFSIEDFARCR